MREEIEAHGPVVAIMNADAADFERFVNWKGM